MSLRASCGPLLRAGGTRRCGHSPLPLRVRTEPGSPTPGRSTTPTRLGSPHRRGASARTSPIHVPARGPGAPTRRPPRRGPTFDLRAAESPMKSSPCRVVDIGPRGVDSGRTRDAAVWRWCWTQVGIPLIDDVDQASVRLNIRGLLAPRRECQANLILDLLEPVLSHASPRRCDFPRPDAGCAALSRAACSAAAGTPGRSQVGKYAASAAAPWAGLGDLQGCAAAPGSPRMVQANVDSPREWQPRSPSYQPRRFSAAPQANFARVLLHGSIAVLSESVSCR